MRKSSRAPRATNLIELHSRYKALFDLGKIYATKELLSVLSRADLHQMLLRHGRGDWGQPPFTKPAQNLERALHDKGRITSGYTHRNVTVWVITGGNQPRKTILRVGAVP